ncbi:BREX system P-loop protein BrxC [Bacillus sp. ISL-47]|uniref:BREX system P-loop protein BrxC n=1 Tax=Bacillus sp. ISL-47 TaxID=2819130 RepID=UPI001BE6306B|nr:BREX system P-loop protein BrxC [Bacillus sp. ISL-47]MBT2687281.1 BREX system P-loop protein BrxC [Bacillus sp. ISL-47]MBT2706649.1 BREX system P-loop protein BrxC [Pseudomonas sp. ISL-84]
MQVKDIFKKDIFRTINGVVQAGQLDQDTIKNELEEYVMTEEVTEYFQKFYENYIAVYKNPTKDIGVWISGFFGSGKSHFLKILSYLLDGKEVNGRKPYEYFIEKTSNQILLSRMKEVDGKDSDAILFNIDSMSSSGATNKERIVEVFLRVFNRHLGYSDTLWLADMERQLDEEGKYGAFKDIIKRLYDTEWEDFRLKAVIRRKKIVQALIETGYDEETANSFFEISKNTFSMTSEKLSQLIAEYCRHRGQDYRLVFLVDEVGQYIGTDVNLMLNLQTVVEDIGGTSMGQAWVIVTSQEKIKAVANIHSTNDFSKIQGRFATRINLSSANTDEVIKRRILEKTDTADKTLKMTYEPIEQIVRNRLSFDPNTTQFRSGYRSAEEFAALYPFIPYQVDLLQKVFNKIRIHGEGGTSLAHGERSLLKAFQEAAKLNAGEQIGNLVTLEEFFPSIRNFLETSITRTISRAEDRARNIENILPEDIPVLKVLYLIKGIDEIKATPNNIATLILETINNDKNDLPVKESLNRLEQAMFIEKHADGTYSFLSDEEQEINKEIRSVEVNSTKIKEQLGKLFFSKMYPKLNYIYRKDTPPFDFNKRFDNYSKGNMSYPLTLQVFSVNMSDMEAALKANSGQMVICLDEELVAAAEAAIKYSEQVQRYVNLKRNNSTTQTQHRIYDAKLVSVEEFEQKAEELLKKACDKALFYIQGQQRSYKGSFENQVSSAFNMLISNTYKYLDYMDVPVSFKTYKESWKKLAEQVIDYETMNNRKAFDELKEYLEDVARMHEKPPSIKSIIEKYHAIPYGWSEYDIIGLILAHMNAGKVKLFLGDDKFTPENSKFYDRLARVSEREKIRVIPEIEVDLKIRRGFISLMRHFFSRSEVGDTYQDFAIAAEAELKERFQSPLEEIRLKRQSQRSRNYPYPGEREINSLSMGVQKLLQIRDAEQMVKEFINAEEEIDEWFGVLEKLKGFYNKTPITVFNEAVEILERYQRDLALIQNTDVQLIKKQISDILTKQEPYRDIPRLPQLTSQLEENIKNEVNEQRQAIQVQVGHMETNLMELKDYYQNIPSIVGYIENEYNIFYRIKSSILTEGSLVTIRALLQQLNEIAFRIEKRAKELEEELRKPPVVEPDDKKIPVVIREKKSKRLSSNEIYRIFFNGRNKIETQQDLDEALNQLRSALLKELKDHTLEID